MLSKDKIINLAFLRLGEQNQLYNINITDRMKIADTLFDVVISELATDNNFMFNARTIRLTKNIKDKNLRGEYRYNLPTDYLNRIWISDRLARIESEFIYSKEEEVDLCYCYEMSLSDYPPYIEQLVVVKLAIRLAEAYDTYSSKIPRLEQERMDIINRITVSEGLPFEIDG